MKGGKIEKELTSIEKIQQSGQNPTRPEMVMDTVGSRGLGPAGSEASCPYSCVWDGFCKGKLAGCWHLLSGAVFATYIIR